MMSLPILLAAAIELVGVVGDNLSARAFFDANNVKVGDPMTLTIDFLGNADFQSLHPPALSKAVDRKNWKLDDISAKTDTYRTARRLTYRIRPMREGVIWFPELEFEYAGPTGAKRLVKSNAVPVHAKVGAQVTVDEMVEDPSAMPDAPELITAIPSGATTEDLRFAWRKACAKPSAEAFAQFDWPEARLNEASCSIREGNWAKALKIYSIVEWRVGQTAELERGIVAALALKYDNPQAELPVWRHVGRPVLRHAWAGRVGIVAGALLAVVLIFWLLSRGIRAVACLAVVIGFSLSAAAQDIFQQMEQMHRQMQRQMQQMTSGNGFSFSFGGREEEEEAINFRASVKPDREELHVGDQFGLMVEIETPKAVSLEPISIKPSESFGLKYVGKCENLPDVAAENPSNVIKRMRLPVRYDVPFKTRLSFTLDIPYSKRTQSNRRGFLMSSFFQRSEKVSTRPFDLVIKPLPGDGQPSDYAGIVSEGLRLHELPDIVTVETNDVVKLTYRVYANGYVPPQFLPPGAAYEWGRGQDDQTGGEVIEYVRYFIADGTNLTPRVSIPYYDPRTRKYRRAETGGTELKYHTETK